MAKKILEKQIENRFFSNLINQENKFDNSAVKVYQKLVFLRYFELIKNSFPLFVEQISQEELEETIKAFMKDTPTTAFIWQMANDYRKFLKKNKIFDSRKHLYEVLYYDWIEIEIYMKEYKIKKPKNFSYKNSYKLSPSARVKRFKYDIINHNFDLKKEIFLVIYYNFDSNEVVYRELNQLIYEVLKSLDKNNSIEKILKNICITNDIDAKEAKAILKPAFNELYINKVFI
ncbi:MAG: hypothetical protein ACNI25_14020 [Halarcobacter sp.]